MKKLLLLIIVSLMCSGVVFAGDNDWIALGPDEANWDVPANWADGWVPVSTEKVCWSTDGTAECIVDTYDAVTGQFVMGDNGPQDFLHRVTIRYGGFLYTCKPGTSWTASGYNRSSSITVEYGGKLETGNRMGVGLVDPDVNGPQTSYLNVDGGRVKINGNLQIGNVGHSGMVNINAGTLKAEGIEFQNYATQDFSRVNISLGTMTIDGDWTDELNDAEPPVAAEEFPTWIANGNVTAFAELAPYGLEGDPDVIYDPVKDVTILTADDPLDRSPGHGDFFLAGNVVLSWLNLPNGGNTVYIDLWYGTDIAYDPNTETYADFNKVVEDGLNTTDFTVLTDWDIYYWRVDTHLNNPLTDPNVVEGMLMVFDTNEMPPCYIDAGLDMITWIDEPVPLNWADYFCDTEPLTVTWSSGGDPNTWFNDLPRGADIVGDQNPTVTCDAYKDVQLTFTAQEDQFPYPSESDTMWLYVYEDACDAARNGDNRANQYQMDIYPEAPEVPDCIIDIRDLLVLAREWLTNYTLTEEVVAPD